MTTADFRSDLLDSIDSITLRTAIQSVKNKVTEKFPSLLPQVEETENTYKYLLHYMTEGYADPSRESQILALKEQLRRIADKMTIEAAKDISPIEWFATMRLRQLRGDDLETILDNYCKINEELSSLYAVGASTEYAIRQQQRLDGLLCDIFDEVRIRYHLSRTDSQLLKNSILNSASDSTLSRIILSALVIASLFIYDEARLELLADIAADSDQAANIRAIAMVGVFLTFSQYPERAASHGKLRHRIELWKEDKNMTSMLRTVAKILIRTADTDNVRKTMDEEVIPRIMKMGPDMVRRMRDASVKSDINAFEENPEWAEMFERTGIRKKLEELSELQNEGADLMMAAFSNLKNFPFFKVPTNWFLPFNPNHSALSGFRKLDIPGIKELFESSLMMADSDKYSFALAIDRIPPQQLATLSATMNHQFLQMKNEQNTSVATVYDSILAIETRRFVRNMYRFTKLFREGNQVPDCFASPIDLSSLGLLWNVIADEELIELASAYYFSRRLYNQALPLLCLADTDPSKRLKEQIGYCLENLNRDEEAIKAYEEALLTNPDSKWLLKRLAMLLTRGKKADLIRATDIYSKLIEVDPDNEKLLNRLATLLSMTERYTDALKYLYKLNYLYPSNSDYLRMIAWTELKAGNFDKSRGHFTDLLVSDTHYENYLGAGHLALIQGNIREAIGFYKECARIIPPEEFNNNLKKNLKFIENNHITQDLLDLISDKVLYDIS